TGAGGYISRRLTQDSEMTRLLLTFLVGSAVAVWGADGRGDPVPVGGVERAAAAAAVDAPLEFFYDLYTFRGPGSATRVVAAFAVPAGRLDEQRVGREVRYRFDVSLVVADTRDQSVFRTDDSVFVAATDRLPRD